MIETLERPKHESATPRAPGPAHAHATVTERVQSIDVLRGFDMFWISGGEHFFHALARATGWAGAIFLAHELSHSRWEGFTFYDLIQPLFLFITGLTLPLMITRRLGRGETHADVFRRLLTRAVLLIIL